MIGGLAAATEANISDVVLHVLKNCICVNLH